ncbi:MAG: DNRLRE domain-containing protein [Bdellovibrionaceae bacterium]|nr:DNRLRE domain-containing protein [Pseudobdellovibrionaceae bacterium]
MFTEMADLMAEVNTRTYRIIEYFDGISYSEVVEIMPVTVSATATESAVALNWTAARDWQDNPASDVTYKIYRSLNPEAPLGVPIASGLTITSYSDPDVYPGFNYYYSVVPVDVQGIEWKASNTLEVQTLGIEPSFTEQRLAPVSDGYVKGGTFSGKNFGTEVTLATATADNLVGKTTSRTFLRFDLSEVASVKNAVLRLKTTEEAISFWCEIAEGHSWTDQSLTWNNQPTVLAKLGMVYAKPVGEWVEFDVSDAANVASFGDKQLVIGIRSIGSDTGSFHSREAALAENRPQLVINNASAPVEEFQLTVSSGSGGGAYAAGTAVNISADAPASGQAFDAWTGDVATVADVHSANTTLTMPAANISITATYEAIPPALRIDSLTITNVTGFANMTNNFVIDTSVTGTAALNLRANATPAGDFGK